MKRLNEIAAVVKKVSPPHISPKSCTKAQVDNAIRFNNSSSSNFRKDCWTLTICLCILATVVLPKIKKTDETNENKTVVDVEEFEEVKGDK